jgi:hypothetical protein
MAPPSEISGVLNPHPACDPHGTWRKLTRRTGRTRKREFDELQILELQHACLALCSETSARSAIDFLVCKGFGESSTTFPFFFPRWYFLPAALWRSFAAWRT